MKNLRTALSGMSARDKKAIAIGLVLLAAARLGLRGIPLLLHQRADLEARALLARIAVERGREALDAHPQVRESLAVRVGRLVALAPRLLDGSSPAEASASLSGLVGGAASLRRVRIVRQESRPDSSASLFDRVLLRVEAEGDIAGISGWIADLEEGDKLVRVRTGERGADAL